MLGLLDAIKAIIYKFEDQKYFPLSLYHAKRNFYALYQGNLPNPDYLDRFMNLVDMAESYDSKLYYQAMSKIAQDSTVYSTTAEDDLQDDEIKLPKQQHERFILHARSSSIPTSGNTDV